MVHSLAGRFPKIIQKCARAHMVLVAAGVPFCSILQEARLAAAGAAAQRSSRHRGKASTMCMAPRSRRMQIWQSRHYNIKLSVHGGALALADCPIVRTAKEGYWWQADLVQGANSYVDYCPIMSGMSTDNTITSTKMLQHLVHGTKLALANLCANLQRRGVNFPVRHQLLVVIRCLQAARIPTAG